MWPKLDSMVEGMHSHASPRSATDGLVSKHIVYASYSGNYVQRVLMQYHKEKTVIHADFSLVRYLYGASALAIAASSGSHLSPFASSFSLL